MDAARDGGRAVRISVIQILAGLVLMVAATVVSWATLTDGATNATTTFRGGPLSVALVLLAAATIVLSAVAVVHASRWLDGVQVAIGCSAVIASIGLALGQIASANREAMARIGPSRTSYALGGAVAVTASGVIVVASLVGLAHQKMSPP